MADASFDFRLTHFRKNRAGIEEVWKGADMRAALQELAESKCDDANAMAHLHGPIPSPLYRAGVDVLDHTAVGYVKTSSWLGGVEARSHQTLKKVNGFDDFMSYILDAINH